MSDLIYPRDRYLTAITLSIGVLAWVGAFSAIAHFGHTKALVGTLTSMLVIALIFFILYLFSRSAAIAHFRGNGVEVTATQFPELYRQFQQCCEKLAVSATPRIYILNGNGVLNAFATWFLGHRFVVLLSGVVDAMEPNPTGIRFYIGHELGHVLRHDNALVALLRWPARWLPLIGAAYSRARESTCDRHGLACSESREGAARSLLVALAAGGTRWKQLSLDAMREQKNASGEFWMSFHELTASYPWTVKRVIRVLDEKPQIPPRNSLAYLLALFVPYAGRVPPGLGVLIYVYIVGVGAAIAIPAYQSYTIRAALAGAMAQSQPARDALSAYYLANKQVPESLEAVGVNSTGPGGLNLSLTRKGMLLTVKVGKGTLVFTPSMGKLGNLIWTCSGVPGEPVQQLPAECR